MLWFLLIIEKAFIYQERRTERESYSLMGNISVPNLLTNIITVHHMSSFCLFSFCSKYMVFTIGDLFYC